MTRVYTPLNRDQVDLLARGESVNVQAAFAVTPAVRALAPDEDLETHEHIVTQLAASAAEADPVVVGVFEPSDAAVEVAAGNPSGGSVPGHVNVLGELPVKRLVCFLVADPGEVVSEDADLELSWYDASEAGLVNDLVR